MVQAGNHVIRMNANQAASPTEWRYDGLDLATVAALRENNWSFSEPDMTGYTVTHEFEKVLIGVPSLMVHTWTGDVTLTLTADDTFTAWTDLQTFTLPEGVHLLNIELFETLESTRVAWIGWQFRMQKNGVDEWAEPEPRRRNARGLQGKIESSLSVPVAGSGAHTLQVRARVDNHSNVPNLRWLAAEQLTHIMTWG